MSLQERIVFAVAAVWLSRVVTIALNLFLLPVMFHHLSKSELGTWLLLLQAGTIVQFMDFGLTNIMNRRIAIASGSAAPGSSASVDDLMASGRLLFRVAAVAVFLLTAAGGWALMPRLALDPGTLLAARLAWLVLCVGYGVNLASNTWSAAVQGLGYIAAASVVVTTVGACTAVGQLVAVTAGGGIVGLSVAALFGSLAQRWVLWRLLRERRPDLLEGRRSARRDVSVALLRPALAYWLTEIGAVLLLRTDQFFIAGFQDPSRIPAYYAAYSLVFNLAGVALAVGDAACVFLSRTWREDDPRASHPLVLRNARIGLALMGGGVAVMAAVGEAVIDLWLGPGHFVGRPVLLVFCAMLTLYVQQSLLLNFSRATENESYAVCYLVAGALNVAITYLLAEPMGLLGIALGTLVAQILSTNWFVPRSALRRLGIAWSAYARDVALPAAGVFGATFLCALLATSAVAPGTALAQVLAGCAAGGTGMAVSFWFLVLDRDMRLRVRQRVGVIAG